MFEQQIRELIDNPVQAENIPGGRIPVQGLYGYVDPHVNYGTDAKVGVLPPYGRPRDVYASALRVLQLFREAKDLELDEREAQIMKQHLLLAARSVYALIEQDDERPTGGRKRGTDNLRLFADIANELLCDPQVLQNELMRTS